MSTSDDIRAFIISNFYVSDPAALHDGTSLIESGIVDSTGMLEIILFIEGRYGFRVADEDMVPENLETIDSIVAFVARATRQS